MSTTYRPYLSIQSPKTILPEQVELTKRERIAGNIFEVNLLKHNRRSQFTSYLALLYAGLLEADPFVLAFTPRPLRLMLNNTFFIPSFFVQRLGETEVVHIVSKPLSSQKSELLTMYFDACNTKLRFIDVKNIVEKKVKAQSWLKITQFLYLHRSRDTQKLSGSYVERLNTNQPHTLAELVSSPASEKGLLELLCIYRLAYQGRAKLGFNGKPLSLATNVTLIQ